MIICKIKSLLVISLLLILTGCATVGKQQGLCEKQYSSFADIVRCTKQSLLAVRPNVINDPEIKLYFLKGDELSEKVNKGEISEVEAKVEWQALYVKLKAYEDARWDAVIANLNAMTPKQTDCISGGSMTHCTTY